MMNRPLRVLCVDDHEIVVAGLKAKTDSTRDLAIIGHLTGVDGLVAEARKSRPDIVLMDIEMPGPDPFEAARDLRAQLPEVRTLFLTAYVRDHFIDAAFEAGGWGYLFKGDDLDSIIEGIRRVGRGEFVLGPAAAGRATKAAGTSKLATLTPREVQVLAMIGRGLSRQDIAAATHRSVKTIDTHRAAIMEKLDIHDRTELALFAVREGIVAG